MESSEQFKVLIVDDTPENIDVLGEILRPHYKRSVALDGERALKIAQADSPPDLVLLDIMMPGIDGYEVCRRLKDDERTRDIPVIFVTAKGQVQDETMGFELGGVDYITKPVSPPLVLARVKAHIELAVAKRQLLSQNQILEEKVEARTREIQRTQDVTIQALASLAETRDNETGSHIHRTQHYVLALAEELVTHVRFSSALDDATVSLLFKSAPLHDIGKVGVPDSILLKPGKLTDEEFEIMKQHARYGRDALLRAESDLGDETSSSFLQLARDIAYGHHEKWDGSGYPEGLAGDAIPISARLMAVADVYDALISRRCYKPPFSHEKAVSIISEGRGSHFDPAIADAFVGIHERFQQIAIQYADSDEERDNLQQAAEA
ncbi:MAG: two-component system response regulator [Verrucomicrobia bacterium]|jgi:putative two-component system response regulator|nr:two-component system response regulator [Verrucomicrobiota bacterium]